MTFVVTLVIVAFLGEKVGTDPSGSNSLVFEQEHLIRKIVEHEPRIHFTPTTSHAQVAKVVEQDMRRKAPTPDSIPKFDNYSVVSVIPNLTKKEISADETLPVSDNFVELKHRSWLTSPGAVEDIIEQAGNRNRTYAWIQISRPVSPHVMERTFRTFDTSVLGSSGDLVRAEVPTNKENLISIRALPWVRGIGALPINRKISLFFQEEINSSESSKQIPIFISVMSSERESEFRRVFIDLGVSVGHFDRSIRVFAAVVDPGQIHNLAQLDFVQQIEPITVVTAAHDTAIPAQGVDKLRTIGNSSGIFSGISGTTTPIGVMDTGLNTNHVDISTFRESICAKNFVDDEDHDLWFDADGHGTHVTGTIVGNGFFVPMYSGMAPGVQHIRFAKVLSSQESGSALDVFHGMDYLTEESSCFWERRESESIRPLIVNMSFSSAQLDHDSRSANARKLDSIVWTHRQLYVVSNSNKSKYGYSNYGAAKNSLPVGAAFDGGEIAGFSSRGPTIDKRLIPLVTGTGVDVRSVAGEGTYDNYSTMSGTSMSTPSVAGLAALLMDASPDHREQPALVRARLMASAAKPDAWFESETQFPRNNTNGPGDTQALYGMGMVSATTTILNNDSENGWVSSGASVEMENNEYAYHDIDIPIGTSRLDVVMTWDEPATDAIGNNVLNDLDLWIDHNADCDTEPCGEHSSESKIDNVEWIIIQDPEPGTYRLKIHASAVYSDAPRAALAWTIIRGDSTPQLVVEVNQDIYETPVGSSHSHQVDLTISTNAYVAKGVTLHIDCRTLDGKPCELGRMDTRNVFWESEHSGRVQRSDGLEVVQAGDHFVLGEITEGNSTNVQLDLLARSSQPMRVYVKAMSWNGKAGYTSFLVRPIGSTDEIVSEVPPSNDNFADPIVLDGSNGSQEFDLLASSKESGEPWHDDSIYAEARVVGSVWFQFTVDRSGLASFQASPSTRDFPNRIPSVQIYQVTDACCGVLGAKLIASSNWSAQVLVKAGFEYRVRVSVSGESLPLVLNWFQGDRPINDNFANAIELSGESGEVSGDNLGATLEVGELYGNLASSVWYQWTAPDDGQWEFQIQDAEIVHILAFVGDVVSDLRLVSNFVDPGEPITLHAKQDQTYRIMVASPDAYSSGWAYDALLWNKVEVEHDRNDMFEDAIHVGSEESGSLNTVHNSWPGIEPDEPEATGVQSRWWKWEAPVDGRYTFFWRGVKDQAVAVFRGSSVSELETAILDDNSSSDNEFVIEAEEDEEYWISVGREKFAARAFENKWTVGSLHWGATPTNNTVKRATQLVGEEGEVTDTNLYATTEIDGWAHLGSSSVWYKHEISEAGWVKYWIEAGDLNAIRLAAFQQADENSDLEFLMVSKRFLGESDHVVEVVVYVDEGMQIFLRIANEFKHQGTNFTLHWEGTDAPNWLTFVGRLSFGRRDGGGNISRLREPGEISFNTDGSAAYVSAETGLHAYSRNAESGALTLMNIYEDIPPKSHHIWDPHRSKLHVNYDFSWWTFAASPQEPAELNLVDSFVVEEGYPSYSAQVSGVPTFALGNNGDYLYRLYFNDQRVYDFSADGNIQYYGDFRAPQQSIFPSYGGQYWYGFHESRSPLYINERITGSPFYERLSASSEFSSLDAWLIQNDYSNKYTFVANRRGFHVFDNQADSGEFVNLVSEYNFESRLDWCGGLFVRKDRYVVELICSNGSIVVEYDPVENQLTVTDKMLADIPDRFGRVLPTTFYLWRGDGVSASPDGRHIYASTFDHGVLIFERYGNDVVDFENTVDLPMRRLDLLQVADGLVQFDDDSVSDGCLESSSWSVGDSTYTVESSKWQEREEGSTWTDVEGTTVNAQLCTHTLEENREYRIVANIDVDGEANEYASNFFARLTYEQFDDLIVSSGEIELNGETYTSCVYLSDTSVGDETYTVFNAKWQSRPDADSVWSYVSDTETSGELCPLTASEGLEYRLVGSIMVNDVRGHRRSNTMQLESSEDSLQVLLEHVDF